MKIIKYLLFFLLAVVALVLIVALFVSKDMNYEKSIVINKSIDSVWNNVKTFKAQQAWMPWDNYDPKMKKNYTGTDGTVGAAYSWESPADKVGVGDQTIAVVDAPKLFQTKLHIVKPFESNADAYISLVPEAAATKVTWGFKSKMPYPMNILKLCMNMDKEMNKDFGAGLESLKKISEK